jgi:hypothetical protein
VSLVPEVSVVVELRVAVEPDFDPVALERAVREQGRHAAKELYRAALRAADEQAVEASGGARQRLEQRWVATMFGRIRIFRYRVKAGGGSFHPLDRVLGLSGAEPSAGLRELLCFLSTRLPYRQAAEVAARLTGEDASAQSAWRTVQAEGARIRAEEAELVRSVFEDGEIPPSGGPAPELVVVEADGTYLAAQGEGGERFEVKTAVFYTGKRRAGGRRHRRWRLLNKGCYATTSEAEEFGMGLAARGFDWMGIHRARWILACHDGLDQYGPTFRGYFPGSIHQIDHFHVAERLWRASGADSGRFHALKDQAFTDPLPLARAIRQGRVALSGDRADELAGYLETVAPHLHGGEALPRRLRRGRMRIVGTGVVEKHQDLVVKRRMKRQGMRWSRRGAEHLLALQARRFCDRWPSRWGVIAD